MGFEVAYDPALNIKIVKAIEKHPVVYNLKKYPPVEFKGLADRSWATIASELSVSEGYIKGRWINIKGCFKRYLKNKTRSSATKDYYLEPYLHFMVPFMNLPRRYTKNYMALTLHDASEGNGRNTEFSNTAELEVKLVDSDGEEERFIVSTGLNSSEEDTVFDGGETADWNFFLSLLPDVQKMNPEQKSKFRNALFTAIDMALYGEDS